MKTIPFSEHRPVKQALAAARRAAVAAQRKVKAIDSPITRLSSLIEQVKSHPSHELSTKQLQTAESILVALQTARTEVDTLLTVIGNAAPTEPTPAAAASDS